MDWQKNRYQYQSVIEYGYDVHLSFSVLLFCFVVFILPPLAFMSYTFTISIRRPHVVHCSHQWYPSKSIFSFPFYTFPSPFFMRQNIIFDNETRIYININSDINISVWQHVHHHIMRLDWWVAFHIMVWMCRNAMAQSQQWIEFPFNRWHNKYILQLAGVH